MNCILPRRHPVHSAFTRRGSARPGGNSSVGCLESRDDMVAKCNCKCNTTITSSKKGLKEDNSLLEPTEYDTFTPAPANPSLPFKSEDASNNLCPYPTTSMRKTQQNCIKTSLTVRPVTRMSFRQFSAVSWVQRWPSTHQSHGNGELTHWLQCWYRWQL